MYYCDRCAEENDWPVTMFRSLGTCEECGTRAECSERSTRDLAGEGRVPIPKPEEMEVDPTLVATGELMSPSTTTLTIAPRLARLGLGLGVARGRRSLPDDGGSRGSGSLHFPEEAVSLEEEALGRVVEVNAGDSVAVVPCSASEPPPPPASPDFTRFLSGEGFARWTKRSRLGDDPALSAHCVEARRRWIPYGVALGRALDRLPWRFPTFAPRARPYDWRVD